MYVRYIFWGVAILNIIQGALDFMVNLVEALDPDTKYPTTQSAISLFMSEIIFSFQYFFYAELYRIVYKIWERGEIKARLGIPEKDE